MRRQDRRPAIRRWRWKLIGATVAIVYAAILTGLLLGHDVRGIVDAFRTSAPARHAAPVADDFWAAQRRPAPR